MKNENKEQNLSVGGDEGAKGRKGVSQGLLFSLSEDRIVLGARRDDPRCRPRYK
jgi:hypothetical protein